MEPSDFEMPKELTDELTALAVALHELFDKGMALDEVKDFVDVVFETNMDELIHFDNNGRMND